jgi:hypothetical protein
MLAHLELTKAYDTLYQLGMQRQLEIEMLITALWQKPRWKRRQPWPPAQPFLFTARGTKRRYEGLAGRQRKRTSVLKRPNSLATSSPSKFMFGRGDRGLQSAGRLRMERAG